MDLQELEETAALARLNLDREELEAARPAFEQMLGFFAVMQGADNDGALFPQGSALPGTLETAGRGKPETAVSGGADLHAGQAAGARLVGADHFRGDVLGAAVTDGPGAGAPVTGEQLLENAGERDGRFIVIPNVL